MPKKIQVNDTSTEGMQCLKQVKRICQKERSKPGGVERGLPIVIWTFNKP